MGDEPPEIGGIQTAATRLHTERSAREIGTPRSYHTQDPPHTADALTKQAARLECGCRCARIARHGYCASHRHPGGTRADAPQHPPQKTGSTPSSRTYLVRLARRGTGVCTKATIVRVYVVIRGKSCYTGESMRVVGRGMASSSSSCWQSRRVAMRGRRVKWVVR